MAAPSNTTLRRGLSILDALSEGDALASGGLGVSDLAVQLGMDHSQVSRTLSVLAECGYVIRDAESRKYKMGWNLLLAARRATSLLLVEEAQTLLEELVKHFGQRGYMVVLEGQHALTILDFKPRPSLHESLVGQSVPLHFTASGRALVMYENLSSLKKRLGNKALEQPTSEAPANVTELYRRLATAREDGFVIVEEEMEAGLVSVAVPLSTAQSGMRAAISLVGTAEKFRPRLHEAGLELLKRKNQLDQELEL